MQKAQKSYWYIGRYPPTFPSFSSSHTVVLVTAQLLKIPPVPSQSKTTQTPQLPPGSGGRTQCPERSPQHHQGLPPEPGFYRIRSIRGRRAGGNKPQKTPQNTPTPRKKSKQKNPTKLTLKKKKKPMPSKLFFHHRKHFAQSLNVIIAYKLSYDELIIFCSQPMR